MKVGYSKWRLNLNLVLGILWSFNSVYSFLKVFSFKDYEWYNVLFIFFGPLYLLIYLYERSRGYFIIDEEKVELRGIPKKIINFKDLREMRYFAGDFIFKDHFGKEIFLRKEAIDKKIIPAFEEKFQKIKKEFDEKTEAHS